MFKADDVDINGDEDYPSLGTDHFHSAEHTLRIMATEAATAADKRMGRLGNVFDASSGRLKPGDELLPSTGQCILRQSENKLLFTNASVSARAEELFLLQELCLNDYKRARSLPKPPLWIDCSSTCVHQ